MPSVRAPFEAITRTEGVPPSIESPKDRPGRLSVEAA